MFRVESGLSNSFDNLFIDTICTSYHHIKIESKIMYFMSKYSTCLCVVNYYRCYYENIILYIVVSELARQILNINLQNVRTKLNYYINFNRKTILYSTYL